MTAQEEQQTKVKIEEIKKEMSELKGTPCEVYSRVCGYLRPVQSYNKGKQEEFFLRAKMKAECCAG